MVTFPNNCRCSEIKVSPANWDKKSASTKKQWRIHYRFYDPGYEEPYQVVIISGIKQIKDLPGMSGGYLFATKSHSIPTPTFSKK